jgi:hypothetical protein
MRTRTLGVLAGGLALAVALALTNPTLKDYGAFLEQQLGRAVDRIDQTLSGQERDLLRGLYATRGKQLVELVVQHHTRRRNFGLFSLFESAVLEQKVIVVGVASTFVPVGSVDEAMVTIGRLVPTLK